MGERYRIMPFVTSKLPGRRDEYDKLVLEEYVCDAEGMTVHSRE